MSTTLLNHSMRNQYQYAIVALLSATTAIAQRPHFSGEWVRADSAPVRSVAATGDAGFRRGDMGSGWGATLAITQRPDSFIVAYDFFSAYDLQPRVRLAYAADGSESRNAMMIGHAESVQRSRLTWQGGTLVITTQHQGPKGADGRPATTEVRQTLSLEADGTLIVETTRAGVSGGAAFTTRTTYKKKV